MDVFQYVCNGFAINNLVDIIVLFVYGYMHCVSVAEQVVQVAQNFLVGAGKEYTDIVWFFAVERMQRNGVLHGTAHKIRDFAVGIAGDVL